MLFKIIINFVTERTRNLCVRNWESPTNFCCCCTFGIPPPLNFTPAPFLEMYTIQKNRNENCNEATVWFAMCFPLIGRRASHLELPAMKSYISEVQGVPKKSDSILLVAFLGHPRVVWYLCGTFSTAFPCEKTKKRWTKFPRVESSTILHLLGISGKKHHKNCECCPGFTDCQSLLINPKCHD